MKVRRISHLGLLAVTGSALAYGALPAPSSAAPRVGATTANHLTGRPAPANGAAHQLRANPAVIGLALSGTGTTLQPPTSPTNKPYSRYCHPLIDPGFSGKCVVVVAPSGTIAGVVEVETVPLQPRAGHAPAAISTNKPGTDKPPAGRPGPGAQERDLVWRRNANSWSLALVRVFHDPGLPSLVWADDIERDHDPKLVFVTPSVRSGFGSELDLVEATGDVVLYRFLGQGFADVPAGGGLVTYVPGWTEQHGPEDAYDQTLIGYSSRAWRVFSEQYVPDGSALLQHRGAFWDSQAVAAR
jgi:hypothetical protein